MKTTDKLHIYRGVKKRSGVIGGRTIFVTWLRSSKQDFKIGKVSIASSVDEQIIQEIVDQSEISLKQGLCPLKLGSLSEGNFTISVNEYTLAGVFTGTSTDTVTIQSLERTVDSPYISDRCKTMATQPEGFKGPLGLWPFPVLNKLLGG